MPPWLLFAIGGGLIAWTVWPRRHEVLRQPNPLPVPGEAPIEQVRAVVVTAQRQLVALGFTTPTDGTTDDAFMRAIRAFERAHGLRASRDDDYPSQMRTVMAIDRAYQQRMAAA